jgi:hypothetical protein
MTGTVSQTMTRMNRQQVFRRAPGQPCIYCGTRPGTTTEHIIPEAFGGRLTLENASCITCADETHAFEGHTARLFSPYRRQLNIRGKRRSSKERRLRNLERFTLRLDDVRRIKVPSDEFPAVVFHVSFPPPTILFGLPPNDNDSPLAGSVHHIELMPGFVERLNAIRRKYRANKIEMIGMGISQGRMPWDDFGRTLTKIAYSYAVATQGYGAFVPLVTHIILNKRPFNLTHFIGSPFDVPNAATDMHEIDLGAFGWNAPELVIVRLRLFANLQSQAHYIVVGRQRGP